jgi:hypothetical protein
LGVVTIAGLVWAAEILPGPILAVVTEVVDGDTIGVRARIWLGQDVEIQVRILDINTPELRGHCEKERSLALAGKGPGGQPSVGRAGSDVGPLDTVNMPGASPPGSPWLTVPIWALT